MSAADTISELTEAYNMAARTAIAARETEREALTALAKARVAVSEAEGTVALVGAVIRKLVAEQLN